MNDPPHLGPKKNACKIPFVDSYMSRNIYDWMLMTAQVLCCHNVKRSRWRKIYHLWWIYIYIL